MKIDIASVLVDSITKDEAIEAISEIARSGKSGYIVTPYSELVVFASKDEKYKAVLNNATLSLPDGIGILWAAKYLSLKLKVKSKKLKVLEALWQIIYTGAAIIFRPSYIRSVISEQVTGSQLIWDIAKLAAEKGYSLCLVGGISEVAAKTAQKLLQKFPNLKIHLALSDLKFDAGLVQQIAATNSDILLVAYSPPQQEIWLAENLGKLKVKVAIGLGGTFDYVAGKRLQAPRFLHYIGLEWLWRLITQPWRLKRMWNAVPVFIWTVYKYKLKVKS